MFGSLPCSVERRLEDRIQQLCRQLIKTDQGDPEEFARLAVKLRESLTQHISRLRSKLSEYPIARERRSTELSGYPIARERRSGD
jgi:hypothetical protein